MSYDSWDFEPAPVPEADSWDTWDTGAGSLDLPPPDFNNFGKGGLVPPSDFGGKGNFGGPTDFGKGNFGKGNFGGKGMDFGKGMDMSKGGYDMGKGGFDGGMMNFGSGPGDFGKGPMDFGKGSMDFGKGPPMDFGKGMPPMDFGKGPMDFGKGSDFGKGGFVDDFSKGCGKDLSKGGFDGGKGKSFDGGFKGGMGKNDFSDMGPVGFVPVPPPMPGKGMVVVPPGSAPKSQGQFAQPPMHLQTVNKGMNKGFDGGKGFVPQVVIPMQKGGVGGPPVPGNFQAFSGSPPPPPPNGMVPLPPQNGQMVPFAKGMMPMQQDMPMSMPMPMPMPPIIEALPPTVDLLGDAPGSGKLLGAGVKKPRLFLLLTRLAPELQSEHMQQILEQCGEVQAFRRARDPSGKPLSFGFAQFADPEAAWKASTCISKLVLCGLEIKVLLEESTENIIANWRTAQQAALKVTSNDELEFELEKLSVSCQAAVDGKVEDIYGTSKAGGGNTKRREELRKKEQARILRQRKRKAWREGEFTKELEAVESSEKRARMEERARDGIDRTKERQSAPKEVKDELLSAKREDTGDSGGPLEPVAALAVVSNANRLGDLVDKIQSESRVNLFKMDLDVSYLRNEKTFEKKLRPWLERRVDLYMGGPQSDLVEYILRRTNSTISADALVSDLQRYLDENAEPLVERMWRMLIFELMRAGQPMMPARKRIVRLSD